MEPYCEECGELPPTQELYHPSTDEYKDCCDACGDSLLENGEWDPA